MTDTIKVHGSVILTGSLDGLEQIKQVLSAEHFSCHHYRRNALLVADVADHELTDIEYTAAQHGAAVEQIRDTHQVRLAEEEDPNAVKQTKQPNLELLEGGWYRTNQEAFPLLHVIKVRNEIPQDGVQVWLFEVDLVAADALPQPVTLSAEQLKGYSPKPASLDDFEKLDIIPPA
ncbi:hypothetical protein LCGC14_1357150, partial [marine sediment metagenome]